MAELTTKGHAGFPFPQTLHGRAPRIAGSGSLGRRQIARATAFRLGAGPSLAPGRCASQELSKGRSAGTPCSTTKVPPTKLSGHFPPPAGGANRFLQYSTVFEQVYEYGLVIEIGHAWRTQSDVQSLSYRPAKSSRYQVGEEGANFSA